MRKVFATISAAAFVFAIGAPAFAATETIKGELVDQTCYKKDAKNVGAAHRACGQTCAKKGMPMAVLTADGKLYTITGDLAANNNAKLVAHVSHQVEVTGDVSGDTIAGTSIKMAK